MPASQIWTPVVQQISFPAQAGGGKLQLAVQEDQNGFPISNKTTVR